MKKQYLITHHYTDEEVLADDFFEKLLQDCAIAQPFFDLLNTPLS